MDTNLAIAVNQDRARPSAPQVACGMCAMNPLCHPRRAPAGAAPVETRRRLARGEPAYRDGTTPHAIIAVRAGFMKVCAPDPAGASHLVRFLLPGDVAGLDGFARGMTHAQAVALEDCEICEIPAYRAGILADFSPGIGAHLRMLLARELQEAESHAALVSRFSALRRMAAFLLDLARRWGERGYSSSAFRLPMERRDIGEHLGLRTETASRVLSELRAQGAIALTRGAVEILDAPRLRVIAATPG